MNIKQKFRQSVKCGTGKAYFILKDNPNIDFSRDIIKAATTDLAYDGQSEGDRADYVARLINLSSKKEDIVDRVLYALATERRDTWALEQLFGITAIFAKEGNKKAHQAIYNRYHKKVIPGSEWCGQDAIVALDGIEGLKYIAEKRGEAPIQNQNDWEDRFLIDCFQEEHPEIMVYDELEEASKHNQYINKFLTRIKAHKCSMPSKPQRPKYNYRIVKENIEKKIMIPAPPSGIKELTETDIKKLADYFLDEK